MSDEKDKGYINLATDAINKVCKTCTKKCKQSSKVVVVYCPNKINKRS